MNDCDSHLLQALLGGCTGTAIGMFIKLRFGRQIEDNPIVDRFITWLYRLTYR